MVLITKRGHDGSSVLVVTGALGQVALLFVVVLIVVELVGLVDGGPPIPISLGAGEASSCIEMFNEISL